MAGIAPVAGLKLVKHQIPAHKLIPNTSATKKPLLIYRSLFASTCSVDDIETHLTSVGVVQPQWRYTMYSQDHFHSTTHEVLVVANGRAKLCFGHAENQGRVIENVQQGDAIVVPAGVSHRLLEDLDGGFQMVGSYPVGKDWDMCYGHDSEKHKIDKISSIQWFSRDPFYGAEGPVLKT